MILRRYYKKGRVYGKTYTNKFLMDSRKKGIEIKDNAHYELILNDEEQKIQFQKNVDMIMNNTRWILDNLDYLMTYKANKRNIYK